VTLRSAIVGLLICYAPSICMAAGAAPCDRPNALVTPRLARFYRLGDEVQAACERGDNVELADRTKEYLELATADAQRHEPL